MNDLEHAILTELENIKAQQVKVLDVHALTDIADKMIIASGTSTRHTQAVAEKLIENLKKQNFYPHTVEGKTSAEWILIDYVDIVVHVMMPETRQLYNLEQLWTATQQARRNEN